MCLDKKLQQRRKQSYVVNSDVLILESDNKLESIFLYSGVGRRRFDYHSDDDREFLNVMPTRRSQHSQECKDPRRHSFCDS